MPIATIPNWGLGLNTDAMPSELPPGYCTSATNMRFRNGYAERVGGIEIVDAAVPSITPYWIGLYASTSNVQFHIHAGTGKVFALNFAGASTEITRYTDGVEIISMTAAGTTVTVTTATAHGRTTGNSVTHFAALPVEYNATANITVTSPTTYTYVTGSAPATAATYVGGYSYNVTSDFTGAIDDRWTGGTINGIFFLNNPVNGLYFWNGDTSTRLRKMPGAPVAPVCRAFKNYLVQVNYRYVNWSSAAEPGAIPLYWTAAATNDAGSQPLSETQGVLVDSLPLGDVNVIYGRDSRYAMRYIGGNDVFSFQRMPGNDGVRGVSCVVDTPKGHVFFTQNYDVKIHSGGQAQSLAEGRVRSILDTTSTTYRGRSFLCVNPPFNEVWVCICTSGILTTFPETALLWNWNDDTWGQKQLNPGAVSGGTTFAASGLLGATVSQNFMLMTNTTPKIGAQDTADQNFGTDFDATIERTGLVLGDEDLIKNLSRSKWVFHAGPSVFTAQIQHGYSMFPDGGATYESAVTYTHYTTHWINKIAKGGKYLALKATISKASSYLQSQHIRFKTVYVDVTKGGTV
jgi:hypothetical protein